MSGATAATVATVVGATAAAAGTGYSIHQGQMAKKEQDRQKSIANAQMKQQQQAIKEQEQKKLQEEQALKDELEAKRRAEIAKANEVVPANEIRKARRRGRRSLLSGSEKGILEDEFNTKLGG